jgi:protein-S-isoprenylcysteine O-methyltransferase Ste14
MSSWFWISVVGLVCIMPLYDLSLEHTWLDAKLGEQRGKKLGAVLGQISGWVFFLCWFGIWVSPQPRFLIPIWEESLFLPFVDFPIPVLHLILAIPFIAAAFWFGIAGVRGTGLETSETHRAHEVVTTGIYAVVRHPQYLGGLFAHLGFTLLLSAAYSLVAFPLMIIVVYLMCKKEEIELVKEFGEAYENYRQDVPMFAPRLRRKK